MKKLVGAIAVALLVAGSVQADPDKWEMFSPESWDAEACVGVDFASGYISKGQTFNDSMVIQPWLSLSGFPIVFDVWANYDLDEYNGVKSDEFSEVDLVATLPIPNEYFDSSLSLSAWTYPTAEADADIVISGDVGTDKLPVYLGTYARLQVGGGQKDAWLVMPYASYGMNLTDDISLTAKADIVYKRREDINKEGLSNFDLGLTAAWKMMYASAQYIGRIDDEVIPNGAFNYDKKWLFMVGASFSY